jgi:hypothetical protein
MDNTSFAPGNKSMNNSVPPLPQPTPSLPPRRKIFTSHFLELIGLFLVLAFVSYLGVQYWQDKQLVEEYVPVYTPRVDAVTNWKTYTNTQYGFEFKYPSSWNLVELKSDQASDFAVAVDPELKGLPEGDQPFSFMIEASSLKELDLLKKHPTNLKDYLDKYSQDSTQGYANVTRYTAGGISGYKAQVVGGFADPIIYFFEKDNLIFSISATYDKQPLAQEIPATFKFTDSAQFCGGIAAVKCDAGYTCKLDGTYPDAGGTCQKN